MIIISSVVVSSFVSIAGNYVTGRGERNQHKSAYGHTRESACVSGEAAPKKKRRESLSIRAIRMREGEKKKIIIINVLRQRNEGGSCGAVGARNLSRTKGTLCVCVQ